MKLKRHLYLFWNWDTRNAETNRARKNTQKVASKKEKQTKNYFLRRKKFRARNLILSHSEYHQWKKYFMLRLLSIFCVSRAFCAPSSITIFILLILLCFSWAHNLIWWQSLSCNFPLLQLVQAGWCYSEDDAMIKWTWFLAFSLLHSICFYYFSFFYKANNKK